jgi:predicted amidophosphoribosyltransferase
LIDDVLTTGATLVAAATALGAAGWSAVGAITFARALPYERRAAG